LRRILVIKHSALGDIVLSLPHLRAIRLAHARDRLVLATTASYVGLLAASGLFDEVWTDPRAGLFEPLRALAWLARLRRGAFQRVYDLQGTQRTRNYHRALAGTGVEWVGNAPGCSHFHPDPVPGRPLHITLHRRRQLERVGITDIAPPDLGFLDAPLDGLALPERFTVLAPGGAAHRPEKRWPVLGFVAVAGHLLAEGSTPVLVGTTAEAAALAAIARACPGALDLGGRTSLGQLAALGRRAEAAIGNDTGPMHVLAAVGTPVVALYGPASDPIRVRPWGARVLTLRASRIADIPAEAALDALARVCAPDFPGTPRPDQEGGPEAA
jgi:ADP-heptose:LPS heptosyltransferase